ncbi:nitroreductase [Micromonospora sp. Llam0]|uniref:nitroreductase family protein n=1 Tax=Micromonospora sp. Llam0 TaxID=2485143 RepID=UPI000F495C2E|nr:nitroreductase family protein [Micromonospora sp. Llam0]ROO51456.1 nitroreductase [Micromonospora sp. Llam0]
MTDPYQARYLAHQRRKAGVLAEVLAERHAARRFADRPVSAEDLGPVLAAAERAPSSCDRRGVGVTVVRDRDDKALLGGLLVGGVGWVHRAPVVLLLHGDPLAYKAAGEAVFMPYLDAGVMVGHLWLAATAGGLAACYVNPNVRPVDRAHFAIRFGAGIFCGALAVGWPPPPPPDWVGDTS